MFGSLLFGDFFAALSRSRGLSAVFLHFIEKLGKTITR